MNIPDFETMTDEGFDDWLGEMMLLEAQIRIKEIESDPDFENAPGLSKEAYDNLMKRARELERNGR